MLASINDFIKRVDRAHKTSLTSPHVIEVPITSHEGEQSYILCVMGIDCAYFYQLVLDIGTVTTVWLLFLFFIILYILYYIIQLINQSKDLNSRTLDWSGQVAVSK